MTELPPLILAVQPSAQSNATLVAARAEDGTITSGMEAWPRPVPPEALFAYWPTRFAWSPGAARFLDAVRERGGASFPLGTVLQRLGLAAPRTAAQLARALAADLDDIEDPGLFGRKVMAALAARLAAPAPAPSGWHPSPGVAEVITCLPATPGVYTFIAADRSALYVGKARSLRHRVPRHFGSSAVEPEKSRELAQRAVDLAWEEAGSDLEALVREQRRLCRGLPPLNRQERVHRRPRGAWRRAVVLLALPSSVAGCVEACLVAGDGRFHWERVRRSPRVPTALWERTCRFLDGESGWAPGEPETRLTRERSRGARRDRPDLARTARGSREPHRSRGRDARASSADANAKPARRGSRGRAHRVALGGSCSRPEFHTIPRRTRSWPRSRRGARAGSASST